MRQLIISINGQFDSNANREEYWKRRINTCVPRSPARYPSFYLAFVSRTTFPSEVRLTETRHFQETETKGRRKNFDCKEISQD